VRVHFVVPLGLSPDFERVLDLGSSVFIVFVFWSFAAILPELHCRITCKLYVYMM
jgi:hypothetical protein